MCSYIKEINTHSDSKDSSYECDFSGISEEVSHPNDWIIYKQIQDDKQVYTLCIDYLMVKAGACLYGLSRYEIVTSNDNIILQTTDDKSECTITTEKYKYQFKVSDNVRDIPNAIGGIYKEKSIEFISVEKISHQTSTKISTDDKYYLELDDNILNFYIDGVYAWSKIISLRYTNGIYFVLKDKVFTVIENGCGILDVFNLDGSLYKQIETSMEYIETYSIHSEKILRINGFVWQPVYLRQYIDVETIFADKIKQKTISEYDNDFDEDELKLEDLVEDE